MSSVTNTILAFSIIEDVEARFNDVNAFFPPDRSGFVWTWESSSRDDRTWVGGSKNLEQPTFIAAFNYLDVQALLLHMRGIKWEEPEDVQLIVCPQDADRYEILTL